MKIKILKASMPSYWYQDRIGDIFDLVGSSDDDYCVVDSVSGNKYFVLKSDCEIVSGGAAVYQLTYVSASQTADRNNANKLRWDLFDFKSAEETLKVLEFGANKYSPNNWKKGLNREEILESTMRHLIALFNGEEVDPESGLPHTGHINCNIMFYRYHRDNKTFVEKRNNPFKNEDK